MAFGNDAIWHALGKIIERFARLLYPGLLAILLWSENVPPVNSFPLLLAWLTTALTIGCVVYLFSRYILGELLEHHLDKKYIKRVPKKDSNGVATVDLPAYLSKRFGVRFDQALDGYLNSRWGWIHAMASTAIVFVVAGIQKCYDNRGWFGCILFVLAILLLIGWVWQMTIAMKLEKTALIEAEVEASDTSPSARGVDRP